MKATPNLNFTTVLPTKESLATFVTMLRSIYQHLTDVINGHIGFGDGTNADNVDGAWVNVVTPAAPNTDFTVNHNLGRLPVGYWIMQKDRAVDVYTGSVASTKTQLTLRATVASAVIRLFIIGVLLGLFTPQSKAQGIPFHDIALVAKQTSIGVVISPVPSAFITVCIGNITAIPCGATTSIYSCQALSLSCQLSNPTNADINGNFNIWVVAGQTYTVSITGAGVVGYNEWFVSPAAISGSGTVNSCLSSGKVAYYATAGIAVSCDPQVTDDGSGNVSSTNLSVTSLTTGNCVQATTGGKLVTTGGPCGSASGFVTTTGSPAAGNLAAFSGATSVTNTNLTGDVITSGGVATTLAASIAGAKTFSTSLSTPLITSTIFQSSTANPAASGIIRLANGDAISWRNAANTGDLQLVGDSLNRLSFPSGGIVGIYLGTETGTLAGSGGVRLATTDCINWRNNANSADIGICKNSGDSLTYASNPFINSSGNLIIGAFNGGTGASSSTLWRGDGTWAAIPVAGVSEATWSAPAPPQFVNSTTTQAWLATANTGTYAETVLPSAHTLLRFTGYVGFQVSGCSTAPVVAFYDETAASALASLTISNGTAFFDSGVLSVSMTAGHAVSMRITTAGVGCTGGTGGSTTWTAVYK
jgi:hypothetical protein